MPVSSFKNPQSDLGSSSLWLDRLLGLAGQKRTAFSAHLAGTRDQLSQAYRLVYRQYLEREYCLPHPSEMYYTHYCFLPESRTFILEQEGNVAGTVTLITDSPCGIPMEAVFSDEVKKLRMKGRRIGEVSLLAVGGGKSITDSEKRIQTFSLFKAMYDYARCGATLTDLVIMVHPKHQKIYRHMTFEPMGPVRAYKEVCGSPAVPMRLDILRWTRQVSENHSTKLFFSRAMSPFCLNFFDFEWSAELVAEFLFEKRQIGHSMVSKVRCYFEQCYAVFSAFPGVC